MGSIDAPTRRRRILYSIAIGLLMAGGVATSRKTSIVAPVGAILLLVAYRPRTVTRSLLGLAVVLGVLVHFTSPGALGSVLTQLEPGHFNNVLSTTDRTARYDAVRPDLLSHLLLGRGYESYDPHKYRILDNEYLGLLITTGLIGLLAYLGIFATMMSAAHRTIRGARSPSAPRWRSAAFAAVGVIALASGLFDVLSFPHVPYLLFFVGAMIVVLRERSPNSHKSSRRSRALANQMPTQRAISQPKATRVVVGPVRPARCKPCPDPARPPLGRVRSRSVLPELQPGRQREQLHGRRHDANQSAIENYSEDLGGFTPQTSYNLGESVPLKIGTDLRLVPRRRASTSRLPDRLLRRQRRAPDRRRRREQRQSQQLLPMQPGEHDDRRTELLELERQLHDPGQQAAGLGHLRGRLHRRRRRRHPELRRLPGAQRRALLGNPLRAADRRLRGLQPWGCKSLYFDACGGANTIAGDPRAVAVSFDRPQTEGEQRDNHFFGPDYNTVSWLEQQGYDVDYTDDIQTRLQRPSLLNHKVDLVSGHSEYWSYNSFNNFKKARDAGVNIVSLSANTAYWQTRYENNHRTLVCYKTIQGTSERQPRRARPTIPPRSGRTAKRGRSSRRPRAAIPARRQATRTHPRAGASARTNRRTRCGA